jgi:hypothetical protein
LRFGAEPFLITRCSRRAQAVYDTEMPQQTNEFQELVALILKQANRLAA